MNNELQKAQQKEKEYARRQIEEIMERSARKEEWKNMLLEIPGTIRKKKVKKKI